MASCALLPFCKSQRRCTPILTDWTKLVNKPIQPVPPQIGRYSQFPTKDRKSLLPGQSKPSNGLVPLFSLLVQQKLISQGSEKVCKVTSNITPNTRLEGCLFLQTTAQAQDVMEVFRTLTWLVPYYYSFHCEFSSKLWNP